MKVIANLSMNDREWEQLKPTLEPHNITPYKINEGVPSVGVPTLLYFKLPIDDERFAILKKALMDLTKRKVYEQKEMIFSEKEIEEAEFLWMELKTYDGGYPQPEDDYKEISYDLASGCPKCHQGLKQNRPLMLKGMPNFGMKDIIGLWWVYESIITEKLKNLIENEGLVGAEFWPVLKYRKTKENLPFPGIYQLYVKGELPPVSLKTQFEWVEYWGKNSYPCECKIIGRNLPAAQLVYDRASLKKAKDFNRTAEFIGGGLDAQQQRVVSSRVYQLFKKNKVRGAEWFPVIVQE